MFNPFCPQDWHDAGHGRFVHRKTPEDVLEIGEDQGVWLIQHTPKALRFAKNSSDPLQDLQHALRLGPMVLEDYKRQILRWAIPEFSTAVYFFWNVQQGDLLVEMLDLTVKVSPDVGQEAKERLRFLLIVNHEGQLRAADEAMPFFAYPTTAHDRLALHLS